MVDGYRGICVDKIMQNLPFQKVQHRVDTVDSQPSNETGGILVLVTGALMVSHLRGRIVRFRWYERWKADGIW